MTTYRGEMPSLELANVNGLDGSDTLANSSAEIYARTYYKPISDPSLLPRKKSQVAGASSNLVNSIVGAGIIGIPFAFRQTGLVSGVLLLVLVGYFTDKSLRMMVDLAIRSPQLMGRGVWTYDDLLWLPFGRKGRLFVLISMLVTAYGAMVAYLLIIKDTLPVVWGLVDDGDASVGGFVERELVMLITSVCVVVPLSMLRDFSSLSFTSTISVGADILLVVFVAMVAPIGDSLKAAGGLGSVVQDSIIEKGFFIGFGVLTVAMCCQHSAFIVASSLDNPTTQRWSTVTGLSLTISIICCLVLGISGYLGFLDETSGDVLNNFEVGANANFARALLALTMFFTYPMESFVARHVLVQILWDGDLDGYTYEDISPPATNESQPDESNTTTTVRKKSKVCGCLNRRHQAALAIYVATLIPALLVDDLGPVLSITGAIGGCCLAYIGPGLAYLGVFGQDFLTRLSKCLEALNNSSSKSSSTVTAADLPIEGDAKAQLDQSSQDTSTSATFDPHKLFVDEHCTYRQYKKPWWWYPLGTPLWIHVAVAGWNGMNDRLTSHDEQSNFQMRPALSTEAEAAERSTEDAASSAENDGVVGVMDSARQDAESSMTLAQEEQYQQQQQQQQQDPHLQQLPSVGSSVVNYGFAIFFIIFGAIALVAGVASNLYVQINGIFAVPA